MRTLLPIISVLLALVAAGSIAYIAWELSSGKGDSNASDADDETLPRSSTSTDDEEVNHQARD